MSRKPRFNPEITRVKLNPEQAVLACTCYMGEVSATTGPKANFCSAPGTRATAVDKHRPGPSSMS